MAKKMTRKQKSRINKAAFRAAAKRTTKRKSTKRKSTKRSYAKRSASGRFVRSSGKKRSSAKRRSTKRTYATWGRGASTRTNEHRVANFKGMFAKKNPRHRRAHRAVKRSARTGRFVRR